MVDRARVYVFSAIREKILLSISSLTVPSPEEFTPFLKTILRSPFPNIVLSFPFWILGLEEALLAHISDISLYSFPGVFGNKGIDAFFTINNPLYMLS